jgi:glyoxylase-like metal-dependent hydrolase (beta-lactamase superfamily II)
MVKIIQILPGLSIRTSVGMIGACAITLIENEGKIILVDTGHFGNRMHLIKALENNGIDPKTIEIVVLTHLHWDHCLNIDLFSNAKIYLNEKEYEMGDVIPNFNNSSVEYNRAINNIIKETILKDKKIELFNDDIELTKDIKLLETPGHSPGHTAILIENYKEKIVCGGDTIALARDYLLEYPDLIFYDKEKAHESIIKIKNEKPSIIYPGHDRPFKIKNGKIFYLKNAEVEILMRNSLYDNFHIKIINESLNI